MSQSNDTISQFQDITGATAEQAQFYVDSAKGDLNTAMANFFESESGADESDTVLPGAYKDENEPELSGPSASTVKKAKAKATESRRGVNTLGGLRQSDDDDDGEDKPAEYYTGGEKSGLGVIDPTKNKDGSAKSSNLIQELLRKAAAGGQEPAESSTQSSTFQGSGYTLGGEDEESRKVEDPNAAFKRAMASQPSRVTRVLKLWQDGFSVDGGRLYRYDDPANKDYLEAINKGHAPLALLNVEYGQPVDVNVEKKTDEVYMPPPKVFRPFESSGHRLGSEMPPSSTAGNRAPATETSSSSSSAEVRPTMQVDESLPSTSLQIRLASGGRIVSQFNTSHTLSDVYDFVERSHPSNGREFVLLTPFPRKEYARNSTTLQDASLLKGVLQQKFA